MTSIKISVSVAFCERMLEGTNITVLHHTFKEGVGRGMEAALQKSSTNNVRYNAEKSAENTM